VIEALVTSSGPQQPAFEALISDGETQRVPLLLELEDAARQLSVSGRTLRRLARDGEVKAVKIGSLIQFAPQNLEHFVDEKRGS
jgi:excisionase family DNA binding protein